MTTEEMMKILLSKGQSSNVKLNNFESKYCINMNEEVNKYHIISCRDEEIRDTCEILLRKTKNNPLLIGDAGVGKTSVIEGLVRKIVNKDPSINMWFYDKTIFSLSLVNMMANNSMAGTFESKITGLINTFINNRNYILFIDEIHMMLENNGSSGPSKIGNFLKPYLSRGEIRCIGATTFDEYKKYIEKEKALSRRFNTITVKEPSKVDTVSILSQAKKVYEQHHNIALSNNMINLCVDLGDKYITNRKFPDKGFDIIDAIGAKVNNRSRGENNKLLEGYNKELKKLNEEKTKALENQDFSLAAEIRNVEKVVIDTVSTLVASKSRPKYTVKEKDVYEVISYISKIPIEKVSEKSSNVYINMEKYLSSKLLGQDEAIKTISKCLKRNYVDLGKRSRPMGIFMFMGPTGVGKTELCKLLAYNFFGSDEAFIKIDMGEFGDKHTSSKLLGSPPGFIGHEEGGILTEKIKQHPHSVVLFDEIEKAHSSIHNVLLNVFDNGLLTDGRGEVSNFRNSIIIMTSNVGVQNIYEKNTIGFTENNDNKDMAYIKEMEKVFSPEFINRIDKIIPFNKLSKDHIEKILSLKINDLNKEVSKKYGFKFTITEKLKDKIIEEGFSEKYGARNLYRVCQNYIEDQLADLILNEKVKDKKQIQLDVI